jgi:alkyl hydroperoxide reductase subunit AhpF
MPGLPGPIRRDCLLRANQIKVVYTAYTPVPYKQIVVAMGEGAKASLAAFEYLLTHAPEKLEHAA